jgi:hypothetical protein
VRATASASNTSSRVPVDSDQTQTARVIAWFQTGHYSGRHRHDTGNLSNRSIEASASSRAG